MKLVPKLLERGYESNNHSTHVELDKYSLLPFFFLIFLGCVLPKCSATSFT